MPIKEDSVEWDSTKNIFIEGENLEVLKLLQRSYHGKVKLIYIDPPYNTGKDFVYPDNYRDPLGEYLRFSGQTTENGGRLRANAETSGRYHSSWLSMMWPRLHLARSLLRDDGVLVVAVDDNEAARIRLVLDEIFGEENFLAQMVWEGGRKNDATFISVGHDYMLLYARDQSRLKEAEGRWRVPKPGVSELQRVAQDIARRLGHDPAAATAAWREHLQPLAKEVRELATASAAVADARPDIAQLFPELRHPLTELPGARYNRVDSRGAFRASDLSWPGGGGPTYDVMHPVTGKPVRRPTRGWLYAEDTMRRLIEDDRIDFKADETGVPEFKRYLDDVESEVLTSVFYRTRTRAQQDLNELMGEDIFDFPKDVDVITRVLQAATSSDDLVLDFFAGSGTTAEACMALNAEDGGTRRFLLVQLAEPLEHPTYTSLAAVTRERLRRAAASRQPSDPGFRAYRIDASAQPSRIDEVEASEQMSFAGERPFDASRDDEALLVEVLLTRGFDLVTPTTWTTLEGLTLASVADGALVASFARAITLAQFEALVALEPAQLILMEEAFGASDEVKVNALQHLKTLNEHRDSPIELVLL